MRTTIFFVLGPTNVGKSTLLEHAAKIPNVGVVEVGKMMRAKYLDPKSPHYAPDHFKGQAAPTHTANEAWRMMEDGIESAMLHGSTTIFVDGQPRDIQQCDDIYTHFEALADKFNVWYVNLFAQLETRKARAQARDTDPAKLDLSLRRMEGDCVKLYEILARLLARNSKIITLVTDHGSFTPSDAAKQLVSNAGRTRTAYIGNYTNQEV